MKTTIDRVGRVVIPKAIRDQFHLDSGTELEVDTAENEIRIRIPDLAPLLIKKARDLCSPRSPGIIHRYR